MMSQTTPLGWRCAGVVGEFHSLGNLLLAARTARRRGFATERLWYLGEPTHDRAGGPLGFVLPASLVRESALAGALLGGLAGALLAFSLTWTGWADGLARLPVGLVWGALSGAVVGGGAGWLGLTSHISDYLDNARHGTVWLKIGLPEGVSATDRERLAELATQALRVARAEAIQQLDGTVEINSPQSPAWLP